MISVETVILILGCASSALYGKHLKHQFGRSEVTLFRQFFYCSQNHCKSSGSPKTNFVFTPNFRHACTTWYATVYRWADCLFTPWLFSSYPLLFKSSSLFSPCPWNVSRSLWEVASSGSLSVSLVALSSFHLSAVQRVLLREEGGVPPSPAAPPTGERYEVSK